MQARATEPAALTVTVEGLLPGGYLPESASFCAPANTDPSQYNISPAIYWSRGPKGTRSYALIMSDLDTPKDLSLFNEPGVTLTAETPRVALVHWVLVDIPPSITRLARGAESMGYSREPKPPGPTKHGLRGTNVMTFFKPLDPKNPAPRGGFDGPCPPNNDLVSHRYVAVVYALDVATLGLKGVFFGAQALDSMQGHVLATGRATTLFKAPADVSVGRVAPLPQDPRTKGAQP